jgi:4-oxalocrotonate tautomerase
MPHVTVKLWPGKSERQKARLSVAIVKDVMNVLNYGEESVSVAISFARARGSSARICDLVTQIARHRLGISVLSS